MKPAVPAPQERARRPLYVIIWEPADWGTDGWSIMATPLPLPLALAWLRGWHDRHGLRPPGYLATANEPPLRDATVQM